MHKKALERHERKLDREDHKEYLAWREEQRHRKFHKVAKMIKKGSIAVRTRNHEAQHTTSRVIASCETRWKLKHKCSKYYASDYDAILEESKHKHSLIKDVENVQQLNIMKNFQQRERLLGVSDDFQNRIGWGDAYKIQETGIIDKDWVDPELEEQKKAAMKAAE